MKKEGHATQAEVAEYASYAIEYIEQLRRFNPDDYYLKRIELMKGLLMSMDLQVKFTFVEWKTFAEGNPIPGVEADLDPRVEQPSLYGGRVDVQDGIL